LQSAPILITAITAYLAMEAAKYALLSRKHAKQQAAAAADPSRAGS
jgi:hypothetical protein